MKPCTSLRSKIKNPGKLVWGAWGRKFESCHPDKVKHSLVKGLKGFLKLEIMQKTANAHTNAHKYDPEPA